MIPLLVTGACGFIGSNLVNYLYKTKKYKIINIDAMYYCADENNVDKEVRESENYHFIKCNLNNSELIKIILNKYQITHVIHLAAQSHVQNSFENSLQFTTDNVLGTNTLLEECRKYGKIERFVNCSTDEVYGESNLCGDEQVMTEESILNPSNPYSASKAGADLLGQSYYTSFKMPIITSRGNNTYGPNQHVEKLIPRFIQLLRNNEKVTIQGKGDNVRAFLHVSDTARAFEAMLERGEVGEIYNIGCDPHGMEYSVMDVAKMLIRKIKHTEDYDQWITYIPDRPFNDLRYYLSNSKIKTLGWDVTIQFEDGIDELLKL